MIFAAGSKLKPYEIQVPLDTGGIGGISQSVLQLHVPVDNQVDGFGSRHLVHRIHQKAFAICRPS